MTSVFKLPLLGETMETGRVALWLKRPGDLFRRGETILEVETDKTVVEVPALNDGTLVEILADQGAQLKVGEPLCVIRSDASSDVAAVMATPAPSAPASVTQEAPPPAARIPTGEAAAPAQRPDHDRRIRATPRARRLAQQRGIDVAESRRHRTTRACRGSRRLCLWRQDAGRRDGGLGQIRAGFRRWTSRSSARSRPFRCRASSASPVRACTAPGSASPTLRTSTTPTSPISKRSARRSTRRPRPTRTPPIASRCCRS